jgi:NADPH-dependent curcumin reductase CurA
VAEPAAGGVTLKTLALSLDPAMRGRMNAIRFYYEIDSCSRNTDGC